MSNLHRKTSSCLIRTAILVVPHTRQGCVTQVDQLPSCPQPQVLLIELLNTPLSRDITYSKGHLAQSTYANGTARKEPQLISKEPHTVLRNSIATVLLIRNSNYPMMFENKGTLDHLDTGHHQTRYVLHSIPVISEIKKIPLWRPSCATPVDNLKPAHWNTNTVYHEKSCLTSLIALSTTHRSGDWTKTRHETINLRVAVSTPPICTQYFHKEN